MKAEATRPRSAGPNAIQASTAPRLALTKPEAAAALGISEDSFDRHVRPTLPVVAVGSKPLYPVALLKGWLEKNAHVPLDDLDAALAGRREHR